MAISLGATTLAALYLGSTAISTAYLGSVQVYDAGGGADAYAIGGISPELVASFVTQENGTTEGEYFRKAEVDTTFAGLFTFTRSGLAAQFDSSGTLVWAPHNLVQRSETFGTGWTASNMTVAENSTVAPNGENTADTITGTENSLSRISIVGGTSAGAGNKVTVGLFVKAGTSPYLTLRFYDGAVGHTASFDTSNWSNVATGGAASNVTSTAISYGWYRVAFDVESPAAGFAFEVSLQDTPGYSSDGSGGTAFVWGAHYYRSDLGGMADNPDMPAGLGQYVPTTAAAAYLGRRDAYYHNGTSWVKGGLQFEPRAATNLVVNSTPATAEMDLTGVTITENALNSPLGTNQAFLMTEDSATSEHRIQEKTVISWVGGTTYCAWAIVKPNGRDWCYIRFISPVAPNNDRAYFNLTTGSVGAKGVAIDDHGMIPLGDGYYIVWATCTAGATAPRFWILGLSNADNGLSYLGDGSSGLYVAHMQVEADAAFPSSPIVTNGSTVTRAAETLTIAGADNPISATEGTVSADILLTSDGNGPEIFDITNASGNYLRIYPRGVFSTYARWHTTYTPEVTSAQGGLIPAGINQTAAVALGAKASDEVQLVVNGNASTALSTTTIADFSGRDVRIHGNVTEGTFFYRTIRVWSVKLPAADLLTAGTAL